MDVRVEYKNDKRTGEFRISDSIVLTRLPLVGELYTFEDDKFVVESIEWVTGKSNPERTSSYSRNVYVVIHLIEPE